MSQMAESLHRYQVSVENDGDYTLDAGDWAGALALALALVERDGIIDRLEVQVLADGSVLCHDPVDGLDYRVRAVTFHGRLAEEFTLPPVASPIADESAQGALEPGPWWPAVLAGGVAFLLTLALMALVL